MTAILREILGKLGIHNDWKEVAWAITAEVRLRNFCEKVGKSSSISTLLKAMEEKCKTLKDKNHKPVFPETFHITILEDTDEHEWFYFDPDARKFVFFVPAHLKLSEGKSLAKESELRAIKYRGFGLLYSAVLSLEIEYNSINDTLTRNANECHNFLHDHLNSKTGKEFESFNHRANIITMLVPHILGHG
ncbi:MAG: hypothetical protein LBC87_09095 [Fibromonadaceae bacterium]|jgi:hypothetical protein|nr:hypothetical protein [Fibromonadaceae bacterium]